MNITSNIIKIDNLHIYAHHGVLPQERIVGAWFTIDIRIQTDFSNAIQTDELEGTISYADIFEAIKQEMAIPSKLLEHAAGRILKRLFSEFTAVESINLSLKKDNPPMGADCNGAGVEITATR